MTQLGLDAPFGGDRSHRKQGTKKRRPQKNKEELLTKDHIIPQSFLRTLNLENIQMLSKAENIKKGNRLTKEGIEKILKAIIEHL